ncbi:hypothetical protein [Streptomyces sp. JJ36]|uniref:hypothetical protein n=1 Tax=Streptomyces sp. JJ36 TaxID=2736645 RepID=UPI001F15E4FE|nr:hypothetical protein [Streptomyces sp. JJ36]MCF6522693.1 hypothetical protein [Streptomyces sp. JJ36]
MLDWREWWRRTRALLRPLPPAGTGDGAAAALGHDLAAAEDAELAQRFEELGTNRHRRESRRLEELSRHDRRRLWNVAGVFSVGCLVVTFCFIVLCLVVTLCAVLVIRASAGLEISMPGWVLAAGSYALNTLLTAVAAAFGLTVTALVRRRFGRPREARTPDGDDA